MASNKIKINTDSLNSDAQSVGDSIAKIRNVSARLRRELETLDSMWDGAASETFKSVYNSDLEFLDEVLKKLDSFNGFENSARSKYDDCEQKVRDVLSGIKW